MLVLTASMSDCCRLNHRSMKRATGCRLWFSAKSTSRGTTCMDVQARYPVFRSSVWSLDAHTSRMHTHSTHCTTCNCTGCTAEMHKQTNMLFNKSRLMPSSVCKDTHRVCSMGNYPCTCAHGHKPAKHTTGHIEYKHAVKSDRWSLSGNAARHIRFLWWASVLSLTVQPATVSQFHSLCHVLSIW
jgi:hypothetical protein